MSDFTDYLISSKLNEAHDAFLVAAEKLGYPQSGEPNMRLTALLNALIRIGHKNKRGESPEKADTDLVAVSDVTDIFVCAAFAVSKQAQIELDKEEYESALDSVCGLNRILGSLEYEISSRTEEPSNISELMSMLSRSALDERHRENRDMKAQALEHYAKNKKSYSSKDEAALALTKLVPVSFATARKWLKGQ